VLCGGCAAVHVAQLLGTGDSRQLRERPKGAPERSAGRPSILFVEIDGVDRALLYDMLRAGELPSLARLLGGSGSTFPHAYFDPAIVSTLPSSTMVAWATALTGVPPARHGIAGNEFFIRETLQFAAPVPVSIDDSSPVLACYTDDYVDRLRLAPSVWERMRGDDPDVLVWVAMQHFHPGADRLLLTDRNVIAKAFEAFVEEQVAEKVADTHSRAVYEDLDEEVVDVVTDELRTGVVPDVLAVYLSGTDSYAHVADEGPDPARRTYLREVIDPLVARLATRLDERDALANRWVVLTSDHGHSEVLRDDRHALSMAGDHEPPALLAKAGFRVRPFKLDVPRDADFQAVLAYEGAMAYLYVADRATCGTPGRACDWMRPPRYREDVLAAADAFYTNNRDGRMVPELRATLDMVLVRRPRPVAEQDLPFEVYVGGGRSVPVAAYLRAHPHPTYVDLDARLHDLAVGPHGERAGDVVLIAHNGDRTRPEDRYYFASLYRSWHGSPARKDSEIPLIVAHPALPAATVAEVVRRTIGGHPRQQAITDVLLALRQPASLAGRATPIVGSR
jgi:Type I phosphodiesterase / nucleotide pyrophosphatase